MKAAEALTGEVARDLRAARIAQLEGILQVDARAKRLAPRLPAVGVEARGWGAAVARVVEHPGRDLHGEALRVSEMDSATDRESITMLPFSRKSQSANQPGSPCCPAKAMPQLEVSVTKRRCRSWPELTMTGKSSGAGCPEYFPISGALSSAPSYRAT